MLYCLCGLSSLPHLSSLIFLPKKVHGWQHATSCLCRADMSDCRTIEDILLYGKTDTENDSFCVVNFPSNFVERHCHVRLDRCSRTRGMSLSCPLASSRLLGQPIQLWRRSSRRHRPRSLMFCLEPQTRYLVVSCEKHYRSVNIISNHLIMFLGETCFIMSVIVGSYSRVSGVVNLYGNRHTMLIICDFQNFSAKCRDPNFFICLRIHSRFTQAYASPSTLPRYPQ